MSRWLPPLLVCTVLVACVSESQTFVCSQDSECAGGTCEDAGLCSFVDVGCKSGRRYGELSGSLSLQCVPHEGDAAPTTGAPDPSSGGSNGSSGGSSEDTGTATPCLREDFDSSLGEWATIENADDGLRVEGSELVLDLTTESNAARQLGIEHPEPHDLNVASVSVLLTNAPSTPGFYTRLSVHPYTNDAIYLDIRNGEITAAELINTNTIVQGKVSLEDFPPPLLLQLEASPQSIVATVSSTSGKEVVLLNVTDPIWLEEATARLVAGGPEGASESAFRYDYVELCIEP